MKRSILAALVLALVLALVGCNTADKSLGPSGTTLEDGVTALPAGAYVTHIEIEGKAVRAWVVNDRNAPQGVRVIMVLDYPCGFIGPIPAGHGRDCTDTDTPSDEPSTARWFGDPTADD